MWSCLSQSRHKLLAVYDEAGVLTFADEAGFVSGGDGELQLAPLDGGEGGCGRNGASVSCGLQMRCCDVAAYGGLIDFQMWSYAVHGCLFHQGYHRRSGEYAKVAATYVGGQVMLLDGAGAGMGESGL